jgi:hypothetical protein
MTAATSPRKIKADKAPRPLGGGELAREFLKEDLMDRIDLGVMPILPGAGVSSRIRSSYARVSRPPRKKG